MNATVNDQAPVEPTAEKPATLAEIRRNAGKTTRETAAALGLTQPRITQIEQEGTKDVEQMERLAAFYDVDFEVVLAAARLARSQAGF